MFPLATALFAGTLATAAVFVTPSSQFTLDDTNQANASMEVTSLPLKLLSSSEFPDPDIHPDNIVKQGLALDTGVQKTPSVPAPMKQGKRTTVIVKTGDTFSEILSRLGIYPDLSLILKPGKDNQALERIYPGQKLHFSLTGQQLDSLELVHTPARSSVFHRDGDSFTATTLNRQLDIILKTASGTIDSSLYLAGHRAGMSDALILELVHIFRWDIDFALDLREGDSFTILYEKLLLNGEEVDDGKITAAEFINKGVTYSAYRYTDENGNTDYYTPEGSSLHKTFLRTPVHLARISSFFNPRRRHPVLNTIRAHKGIDYAAPTGTPIKATGAGRVIFRGNKGQYGKMIVLKHGNIYTTLYAHMSRYARDTHIGSRVKQGQTIGYVGSTGLSTGPHLHYEFRVNEVHRDPLKVRLPQTKSLPGSEIDRFLAAIQAPARQLEAYTQNKLAMQNL